METNLWNALHCPSTTTELAVLAIYAEAISYPYMKAIRTSSDKNMLNLGPLHSRVYDHMNQIIDNPNILVGADASFKTATTDHLATLSIPPPPTPPAPAEPKSRIKPRSPDMFDRSDLGKLDAFVFQCFMYIVLRGQDFLDEASKVAFMLSYLKGSALNWFQTAATHRPRLIWTHVYGLAVLDPEVH